MVDLTNLSGADEGGEGGGGRVSDKSRGVAVPDKCKSSVTNVRLVGGVTDKSRETLPGKCASGEGGGWYMTSLGRQYLIIVRQGGEEEGEGAHDQSRGQNL